MPRYCPCGKPLERKPKESQAAFEKRIFCDNEHRYIYFSPPRATKNFGMERGKPTDPHRVTSGLLRFLYGKPIPQKAK